MNYHHSQDRQQHARLSEICRAQLYGRTAEVEVLQAQLEAVRQRPPSHNDDENDDSTIEFQQSASSSDESFDRPPPPRRRSQTESTVRYCFVAGLSGTGKSTLVKRAFAANNQCLAACGKFEKGPASTPFGALTTCFTELGTAMMNMEENKVFYRSKLRAVLEPSDVRVLQGMMPNITALWGDDAKANISTRRSMNATRKQQRQEKSTNSLTKPPSGHHQSKDDLERLKYILRLVLVAIALPERPVIFHLDDLQWIDPPSLAVVQTLFQNSALQHCLFVGSYRSDEIIATDPKLHSLIQWMDNLEPKVQIDLPNLTKGDLQAMLQSALQIKPYDGQDRLSDLELLATTLHKNTDGNAFHFLESLDYLQAEGLLTYNPLQFQWTWDIHQVQNTTSLSDNMVGIVVAKIQRLPENSRKLLELCSLVGFRVDVSVLKRAFLAVVDVDDDCGCEVGEDDSSNLVEDLEILTKEGLLEALQDERYKFSHDKVFQAACALQSTEYQTKMHLVIGRELRMEIDLESCKTTEHDVTENRMLFLCVDQLNLARHLITDGDEIMDLTKLNLAAAQKAAALSAFVPAAEYAQIGNSLLGDNLRWTTANYDLSLELATLLAVMSAVTGEMDKVFFYTTEVSDHGRRWLDKLRARAATMEALSAKDRHAENYQQLVQVLSELGRELPKQPNQQTSLRSMKDLAKKISSMSDEQILSLPEIQCEEKIGMLDLLGGYIATSVTGSAPHVVEAVGSCMIWEILDNGLSPEGAVAFALMANRFDSIGETQLSRRCSKISRTLAKRDGTLKVRALVGSSLSSHWTVSLSGLTDMTLKVFTLAMRSGDLSSAFHACLEYTSCYFYSGLPLPPLYDDCKKSNGILHDYGRNNFLLMNYPFQVAVSNLCGYNKNILSMDQSPLKDLRKKMGWKEGASGGSSSDSLRMQIAFYCEEFELAYTLAKGLIEQGSGIIAGVWPDQQRTFFYCLMELQQMRDAKRVRPKIRETHRKAAQKHYDQMRHWVVDMQSINSAHKLLILDAEMMSISKSHSVADVKKAYDKGIAAAIRTGFLQDGALAAHLAGRTLSGSDKQAYWERSMELYTKWGAKGVVSYLSKKKKRNMLTKNDMLSEEESSAGFRARSRIDVTVSDTHKKLNL